MNFFVLVLRHENIAFSIGENLWKNDIANDRTELLRNSYIMTDFPKWFIVGQSHVHEVIKCYNPSSSRSNTSKIVTLWYLLMIESYNSIYIATFTYIPFALS